MEVSAPDGEPLHHVEGRSLRFGRDPPTRRVSQAWHAPGVPSGRRFDARRVRPASVTPIPEKPLRGAGRPRSRWHISGVRWVPSGQTNLQQEILVKKTHPTEEIIRRVRPVREKCRRGPPPPACPLLHRDLDRRNSDYATLLRSTYLRPAGPGPAQPILNPVPGFTR